MNEPKKERKVLIEFTESEANMNLDLLLLAIEARGWGAVAQALYLNRKITSAFGNVIQFVKPESMKASNENS